MSKKQVNPQDILANISSDNVEKIQDGYRHLINSMKAGKVKIDNNILKEISNYVIKHLNDNDKEQIRETLLEVTNFLIDFITDHEDEDYIISEIVKSIGENYIGNSDQACRDQIQSIINTIIPSFGFSRILGLLNPSTRMERNPHDYDHIKEHKLSITLNLIDFSIVQVKEIKSLFPSLVHMLNFETNQMVLVTLNNCIASICREMGQEFLNEISDLCDSEVREKIEKYLPDRVSPSPSNSTKSTKSTTSSSSSSLAYSTTSHSSSGTTSSGQSTTTTTSSSSSSIPITKKSTIPIGIQLQINNLNPQIYESRMNEIVTIMNDPDQEWKIKLNNILIFQLMLTNNATKLDNFMTHFHRFKDALTDLVNDKRSQVIKETCTTVSTLVQQLGSDFEPFVNQFVDALVKNLPITIKVVSDSSDACIKSILKYSRSTKFIYKCLDIMENEKSPILRSKACEYLNLLMNELTQQQLEKYSPNIEKIIVAGVSDASPSARSFSRQSFVIFSKYWSQRSVQLLNGFDLPIQKAIQKDLSSSGVTSGSNASDKPPAKVTRPKPAFLQLKPQAQTKSSSLFSIPIDDLDDNSGAGETPTPSSSTTTTTTNQNFNLQSSIGSSSTNPFTSSSNSNNNNNNNNSNQQQQKDDFEFEDFANQQNELHTTSINNFFNRSNLNNNPFINNNTETPANTNLSKITPSPVGKSNILITPNPSPILNKAVRTPPTKSPSALSSKAKLIDNNNNPVTLPKKPTLPDIFQKLASQHTSSSLSHCKNQIPSNSVISSNDYKKRPPTAVLKENEKKKLNNNQITSNLPVIPLIQKKASPILTHAVPVTQTLIIASGSENEVYNSNIIPSTNSNLKSKSAFASVPSSSSCLNVEPPVHKVVLSSKPPISTEASSNSAKRVAQPKSKALLILKQSEKQKEKTANSISQENSKPIIPKTQIVSKTTTVISKAPSSSSSSASAPSANSRAKNYVKELIMNQKLNVKPNSLKKSGSLTPTSTVVVKTTALKKNNSLTDIKL